ncbi:MAG: hypothetical protein KF681_11155 [Bdellovibrionaceae bacterium]|nr:hypothetical protein [Pseudobdellovibrionaceae bacterium]MBX3039917.1 hypothetical protein [Pseudobdellovibrionaceae bacterium]
MSEKHIPLKEIIFAAKTGFLSKDLWQKFFTTRSYSRNSRVWHRLKEDGFFRPHESKMLPNVLILGNRSLVELERRGIMAVTKPHLGQFDHDEKAANIILSLEQEKVLDGFTTEAELKRKNWLWMKTTRDGKDTKFPDLTLQLSGSVRYRNVALEIEQSKKGFDRYKKMMNSYANIKGIDVVVFISNQEYIFNSISRAMKEISYPSWERPVGFGEMDKWLNNPLTAPIYLSRGVESIEQWMDEKRERAG